MARTAFLIALIMMVLLVGAYSFGPLTGSAYGQGFQYQEFDGIIVYYTPKDTSDYRDILPKIFDLPDQPLVQVFDIDYYKMASWFIEPYREVAVFLLGKYKGEEIWHCITMPVTSDRARIGGIRNLGFPKVMADISLVRQSPIFSGNLKADGKTILELTLDTKDRSVTDKEREWFKRLAGIPQVNFLNGKLIYPIPAARGKKTTMLELSDRYPWLFKVLVGQATLKTYPEAAPKARDWKPKAFGLELNQIVLAYYFQNKYGFSFGRIKEISDQAKN